MRALLAAVSLGSVLAWGSIPPQVTLPAEYEVALWYTGYQGLATSSYCEGRANPAGYDSLTGIVRGVEPSQPDGEDVEYRGTLKRTTKIDFCQTRDAPTVDQVVWCIATLTGSAEMDVEITVYESSGRGAWVKARRTSRMATSSVQGDCETADMREIQQDYPGGDEGGGAGPNGAPIEDEYSPVKFVVGGIPALREGSFTPDPKQGGWVLKVIRKIR